MLSKSENKLLTRVHPGSPSVCAISYSPHAFFHLVSAKFQTLS
jgi:hypothetical protein